MTLVRYNPALRNFSTRSFNSILDRFFQDTFETNGNGNGFVPAVDISETDKSFEMEFAVPGFKKEDFTIDYDEGTLTVSAFAEHAVTRHLAGMAVQFYRPRPIEAIQTEASSSAPDKARVKVLAASGQDCWVEADLEQMPPRFDEGEDRPGPVSLAVAIERGPENVTDMAIRPTRLVVIGDASFVSNGALSRGIGSNIDLFMGGLNWLVERDDLVAIEPRPPNMLSLNMSGNQTNKAFLILVGGIPGCIAVLGLLVWLVRRN